jgi:hypothetical protein
VPGTPTTFAWTVSNGGCTSTVDQVVVNPPTGPGCWVYCTPTQDGNYPITNVTFGTINNSNTGLGVPYQNFNNLCTSVTQGQTYNISVTSTGLSPNVFNTAVYFDWNNDGDYSDAGEFYDIGGNGTSPHTLNLNIVIPSTATLGTTSMLVYNQYNVDAAPCQAGPANGQAESYCVTINFAPGTCSDGILNNAETQIDCGGPNCAPCPPTCSDGIQNQGEDDVDCGGPCPACALHNLLLE